MTITARFGPGGFAPRPCGPPPGGAAWPRPGLLRREGGGGGESEQENAERSQLHGSGPLQTAVTWQQALFIHPAPGSSSILIVNGDPRCCLRHNLAQKRRSMRFYFKTGILSVVLGLTAVMVIYWVGIGSYNSSVCREQYHYLVEQIGYRCRLLGFPTAYVENDAWGHNAHVYPLDFLLNLLFWSAACFTALGLVRNQLKAGFKALSDVSTPTRLAIILELLAVPLIVLILMNDLPIRLGAPGDLSDLFFRPFNHWSVLYLPLPIIAVTGCLLGIAGVYRQLRTAPRDRATTNLVLALPFFMAVWIVIAMIFVGWIPEVV